MTFCRVVKAKEIVVGFTAEEQKTLVNLLYENLAYYHETLVLDHKTVDGALAAYDTNPAVTALSKLDPKGSAELRKNIKEQIEEYLD
jgi:hypothetical protein